MSSGHHGAICARDCGGSPLDKTYFVLHYTGLARRLIHEFKIHRSAHLALLLKTYFEKFLEGLALSDVEGLDGFQKRYRSLVPIPASAQGLHGPDHPASLIARELSRVTGIPVRQYLEKTRPMKKQSSLRRNERKANVEGAFRLLPLSRQELRLPLLLVDDVITTGFTAMECARLFKEKGAARIDVFACARGPSQ